MISRTTGIFSISASAVRASRATTTTGRSVASLKTTVIRGITAFTTRIVKLTSTGSSTAGSTSDVILARASFATQGFQDGS